MECRAFDLEAVLHGATSGSVTMLVLTVIGTAGLLKSLGVVRSHGTAEY